MSVGYNNILQVGSRKDRSICRFTKHKGDLRIALIRIRERDVWQAGASTAKARSAAQQNTRGDSCGAREA